MYDKHYYCCMYYNALLWRLLHVLQSTTPIWNGEHIWTYSSVIVFLNSSAPFSKFVEGKSSVNVSCLHLSKSREHDCVCEYTGQTHLTILRSERWMSFLCCFTNHDYLMCKTMVWNRMFADQCASENSKFSGFEAAC